jgi:hypothetical protein
MSSNTSSKDYGLESQRTIRSRETEVGRNSKVFVDIVGCKGIKHQIAPSRNKE